MNRTEFYEIIKNENLDKYPIGDSKELSITPYVVGCVYIDGDWCVYENDERGEANIISRHQIEQEGLDVVLSILRKKKRRDELMKKTRR
jgi:hypothetical protein